MRFRRTILLFFAGILSFSLCACQENPSQRVVASKNDGSFDISGIQSATVPSQQDRAQIRASAAKNVHYSDTFTSTDDSVMFSLNLNKELYLDSFPIIEVKPHFLTTGDAKRVAEALFANAELLEAQPLFATEYSKSEIQERINRWAHYSTDAAIEELYGSPQNNAKNVIQQFIADYTLRMETAPEFTTQIPCQWSFKESWQYSYSEAQIKQEKLSLSRDKQICATTILDNVPYLYSVSTRNESDFKYNIISAVPAYGLSPCNIDTRILRAQLCRTPKPQEDQITSVKKTATRMLEKMGLGDWMIDQCEVQQTTYGEIDEYTICVQAVPQFNGAKAIRKPQLSNLKSRNEFASNYYLTDAKFIFSPDGILLGFELFSPVDIVSVVNKSPTVLSIEDLIDLAKRNLMLSDAYTYGFGNVMEEIGQEFDCNVSIDNIEYGLTRIKVPDTDAHYYYIPSLVLYGDIQYSIHETGEICFRNENVTLLNLNAVDGSIVPISNE